MFLAHSQFLDLTPSHHLPSQLWELTAITAWGQVFKQYFKIINTTNCWGGHTWIGFCRDHPKENQRVFHLGNHVLKYGKSVLEFSDGEKLTVIKEDRTLHSEGSGRAPAPHKLNSAKSVSVGKMGGGGVGLISTVLWVDAFPTKNILFNST